MVQSAFFHNDGLVVGLARADAHDIRPNLLRILTDLYVQKSAHSADEERHYTELALRLLDVVQLPVRVAVAIRLLVVLRSAGRRPAPSDA